MSEINFRRYREYAEAGVAANNAMIALLAGSRLAAHSLQLHNGSPHQLPGLFPAVQDIDRFNLLPGQASELLLDADAHLSAVAIPYALAVYEAFVKDAIGMLKDDGYTIPPGQRPLNAGRMHRTFFEAVELEEPDDVIKLFHVLRSARNAQIHHAGVVTDEVTEAIDDLSIESRQRWEQLTMGPVDAMIANGSLRFSIGHLIAAFAVTKEAARRINATLGQKISRSSWAIHAVQDFEASTGQPRNSVQWKRKLEGYARHHYGKELNLNSSELETAARVSGVWTGPSW